MSENQQNFGSFSSLELLEFMMKFDSYEEMKKGVIDGFLEFKDHVSNMIKNFKDLYNEYLFPNLFSSVQVKIELCAAHETVLSCTIGDKDSGTVINKALDDVHKHMKETEAE